MNGQSITLRDEMQAHQFIAKTYWPWIKEQLANDRPVDIEARLTEDKKTDKQRKFLHGYILMTIAQQAAPNGVKFPMQVWKEHFRSEFLGFKTVTTTNPLTRKKSRKRVRVSTEDLGVKGYSEYIDRVAAFAATDLAVEFVEEWTCPDTGEIFRLADMRHHKAVRKARAEREGAAA